MEVARLVIHQPKICPESSCLRIGLDSPLVSSYGCGKILSRRGLLCRGGIGLQLFIVIGLDGADDRIHA